MSAGPDALLPAEMALAAEEVGVKKAALPALSLVLLGVLAGAFIGLGALFGTVAGTDPAGLLPWGLGRVLTGFAFATGLVLVIVGGAELFTGNALLAMAWASGRVSTRAVVRNWVLVFLANALGAVATAFLVFAARSWTLADGAVGRSLLDSARTKCALEPLQAIAAGILANALVCLAVWLTFSARSTVDRVIAVILPVAAFVASGFEHSIANLFTVPLALLVKASGSLPIDVVRYEGLTVQAFLLNNLLPVTLGNLIGGTVLVGSVYWLVYLRIRPPATGA